MAKVKITAAVTLQEQLAADIYDMRIKAPEIAESAVPGQFVSLYSKDGARILPRPISLCGIDKEKGELRLEAHTVVCRLARIRKGASDSLLHLHGAL